jgi:hypothetical protein
VTRRPDTRQKARLKHRLEQAVEDLYASATRTLSGKEPIFAYPYSFPEALKRWQDAFEKWSTR